MAGKPFHLTWNVSNLKFCLECPHLPALGGGGGGGGGGVIKSVTSGNSSGCLK